MENAREALLLAGITNISERPRPRTACGSMLSLRRRSPKRQQNVQLNAQKNQFWMNEDLRKQLSGDLDDIGKLSQVSAVRKNDNVEKELQLPNEDFQNSEMNRLNDNVEKVSQLSNENKVNSNGKSASEESNKKVKDSSEDDDDFEEDNDFEDDEENDVKLTTVNMTEKSTTVLPTNESFLLSTINEKTEKNETKPEEDINEKEKNNGGNDASDDDDDCFEVDSDEFEESDVEKAEWKEKQKPEEEEEEEADPFQERKLQPEKEEETEQKLQLEKEVENPTTSSWIYHRNEKPSSDSSDSDSFESDFESD
eukprot:g4268.t1